MELKATTNDDSWVYWKLRPEGPGITKKRRAPLLPHLNTGFNSNFLENGQKIGKKTNGC